MVRILAAGFVLAVIAGAWFYLRGSSSESSDASNGGLASATDPSSPGAGGAVANDPHSGTRLPRPVRMTATNPSSGAVAPQAKVMSLSDAFASEAPSAVAETERTQMIRGVVDALVAQKVGNAHISGLECRARHCLLKIAGDDPNEVVALVDALQDERGFLGKAESLMMSRDEESIHIYLRFAE